MEYNRPEWPQGCHQLGLLRLQTVLERVFRQSRRHIRPSPAFRTTLLFPTNAPTCLEIRETLFISNHPPCMHLEAHHTKRSEQELGGGGTSLLRT